MGVDIRMSLSLGFNVFVTSVLFLLFFHIVFIGLWNIGLVSRVAGRRPAILTILQNCAVLSVACCIFYSHCGNRVVLRERPLERRISLSWFNFWKKDERNTCLSKFLRMNELKDSVCSYWFAPVGSASDYPLLSKWVIYVGMQWFMCWFIGWNIPLYSLWATFIGLYIANYVVERSTGWALTHPLSLEEHEKSKNKQMKPDCLDMVPWYSRTSSDLFKTVFDLLVSVTVFVGRFNMLMMQAAMSKICEEGIFCMMILLRRMIYGLTSWLIPAMVETHLILWLGSSLRRLSMSTTTILYLTYHVEIYYLLEEILREDDYVIIMTHEPNWLLDWYFNDVTGKNVAHLICDHLKGRCKL